MPAAVAGGLDLELGATAVAAPGVAAVEGEIPGEIGIAVETRGEVIEIGPMVVGMIVPMVAAAEAREVGTAAKVGQKSKRTRVEIGLVTSAPPGIL